MNRRNNKGEQKKKNKHFQLDKLLCEDQEVENDLKSFMDKVKNKKKLAHENENKLKEEEEENKERP